MIDGLKLTFSGDELRTLLDDRIRDHEEEADRWTREENRTKADETEEAPLLPTEMCEYEAERHRWRVSVLTFIRDHLEPGETYRLDSTALDFGELLPPMPADVAQQEYEERTAVGFHFERLVKTIDRLVATASGLLWHRHSPQQADGEPGREHVEVVIERK